MKKSKLLLGSAILSVALLGTGYAYWTDALTVESTVKSGNFNVVMEKLDRTGQDSDMSPYVQPSEIVITSTSDANACVATLNFDKLYPGAKVTYPIRISNKGSIPAVLENCNVNFNNNLLLQHMTFKVGDSDNIVPSSLATAIKGALSNQLDKDKNVDLVITATLNDLGNDLQNYDNKDAKLDIQLNWSQFNFKDIKK
ncbi:MAG: hypothetical protein AB9856_00680 [Cellulosilyticaceae bacterium]